MSEKKPIVVHIVDEHPERYVVSKVRLSRRVKHFPKYLDPAEVVVIENRDSWPVYSVFALTGELQWRSIN